MRSISSHASARRLSCQAPRSEQTIAKSTASAKYPAHRLEKAKAQPLTSHHSRVTTPARRLGELIGIHLNIVRGGNGGKTTLRQIIVQVARVFGAGEPHFYAVIAVNLWIPPRHAILGIAATTSARTLFNRRLGEACDQRLSSSVLSIVQMVAGAIGSSISRAPGRTTTVPAFGATLFARTTAM